MIIPFGVAALFAFLLTPLVIKYAKRMGIIDDPKKNSHPKVIHTTPTPRGGGISLFIAIFLSAIIFLPLDKHLLAVLGGGLILVVLGFLDDKYNLNPYFRLSATFLAALLPVLAGIGVSFISSPLGGIINLTPAISGLLTLLWLVFLMNMLNMGAKGVDGQLSGVVVIAALTLGLLSLKFSADITEWPIIILAGITAGAYFGFLPYHIYPQKIMPGYGGAILAGYLLGVISILSTTKIGTLMVALVIPIIDTGYAIIRRIAAGKSPVWGDRGHLHHRLLDLGLTKRQVAFVYWLTTLFLSILALNLNTTFKFYTIIGLGLFGAGLILWLTYRPK